MFAPALKILVALIFSSQLTPYFDSPSASVGPVGWVWIICQQGMWQHCLYVRNSQQFSGTDGNSLLTVYSALDERRNVIEIARRQMSRTRSMEYT